MGPADDLEYVSFNKQTVDWIDSLIEFQKKHGSNSKISGEGDWLVLEYMYKGLSTLYPDQMKLFEDSMKFHRSMNKFGKGVTKEKNAMVQHKIEIPQVFYHFLKILYPFQQLDRDFVNKLEKRFPQFLAYEK